MKLYKIEGKRSEKISVPNWKEILDMRDCLHLSTDLRVAQGRVHNWLDRYFPEFLIVLRIGNASLHVKYSVFVCCHYELVSESEEALLSHLRQVAKRGLGIERMRSLKAATTRSVGIGELQH